MQGEEGKRKKVDQYEVRQEERRKEEELKKKRDKVKHAKKNKNKPETITKKGVEMCQEITKGEGTRKRETGTAGGGERPQQQKEQEDGGITKDEEHLSGLK